MERDAWGREYRRLCVAYNRTPNVEQAGAYFAALSGYPIFCVEHAITKAVEESRGWPSAAELAERARIYRSTHSLPASSCQTCHGDKMTQHRCDEASPAFGKPCGSCGLEHPTFVHGFWYARPCSECHPSLRRDGTAA